MHVKFDGTPEYQEKIDELKGSGPWGEDEVIFISAPVAMRSGAGWYVGSWCLTAYDGEHLFPEPYDRATEYLSEEIATAMAKQWREDLGS